MDEGQHRAFARVVNACRGKVAVSGYDHPVMGELFGPGRWFKTLGAERTIHSTKDTRREVLWTNFRPEGRGGLFG